MAVWLAGSARLRASASASLEAFWVEFLDFGLDFDLDSDFDSDLDLDFDFDLDLDFDFGWI